MLLIFSQVSHNSLHMVPLPPPPAVSSPSIPSSSAGISLPHPVPLRGAPEGSNAPPPLANPPAPPMQQPQVSYQPPPQLPPQQPQQQLYAPPSPLDPPSQVAVAPSVASLLMPLQQQQQQQQQNSLQQHHSNDVSPVAEDMAGGHQSTLSPSYLHSADSGSHANSHNSHSNSHANIPFAPPPAQAVRVPTTPTRPAAGKVFSE